MGERCTTQSVSDGVLNGFLVNRPCEDSFSVSIFSVLLVFYSLSQPIDGFAHRETLVCTALCNGLQ